MKSLNIIFTAFALLTFSGCYTQLLIEDDSPITSNTQPAIVNPNSVVVSPLLPGMQSEEVYVVVPTPVYVPVYSPEPITGYSNPAGSGSAATVQRTSGEQRSAPVSAQPAAQDNSRNTGATRSGGR